MFWPRSIAALIRLGSAAFLIALLLGMWPAWSPTTSQAAPTLAAKARKHRCRFTKTAPLWVLKANCTTRRTIARPNFPTRGRGLPPVTHHRPMFGRSAAS